MAFDILILNGTIVDGTNSPRYKGDVGVSDGRIEAIGALGDAEAARRIDAAGHVVCPGFIDMHSHSDVTMFDDPGGDSKAYQGVTTEVTGNCSYTPFPAGKGGPKALQDNIGKALVGDTVWEWDTLDDWAGALESNGISINLAPQVGNSALQIVRPAERPGGPGAGRRTGAGPHAEQAVRDGRGGRVAAAGGWEAATATGAGPAGLPAGPVPPGGTPVARPSAAARVAVAGRAGRVRVPARQLAAGRVVAAGQAAPVEVAAPRPG